MGGVDGEMIFTKTWTPKVPYSRSGLTITMATYGL